MRTLAEIEAATKSLSPQEKQELLHFLATRLRGQPPPAPLRIYSDDEITAMLEEDEADGQRLREER